MNRTARRSIRGLMIVLMMSAGAAVAQDFAIDWHTIDGGGDMLTTGGDFELSGTIGQGDASSFDMPMTGGGFELVGGFWPVAASPTPCVCLGDFTGDNARAGNDIQGFVDCLVAAGPTCDCADIDGNATLDMADVNLFVADLLASPNCP